MNFAGLTFIDASRATASFVTRYRDLAKPGDDWPLPHILLRRANQDQPILADWKTMRNVLSQIRSESAKHPLLNGKPARIKTALVFMLGPGKRIEWQDPPQSRGAWLWLTMIPAPAAMVFSGTEGCLPPVGGLTAMSRAVPFSAINTGVHSATMLVLDAATPE